VGTADVESSVKVPAVGLDVRREGSMTGVGRGVGGQDGSPSPSAFHQHRDVDLRLQNVATLVCGTAPFILHFSLERSPQGTLFILRNVERHHRVTVHSFCVSMCTRPTLSLVALTRRSVLGRSASVAALLGMRAVRRIISCTVSREKLRDGFVDLL
jgi:hypothetical protein